MGLMTSSTPCRKGAYTSLATDFTPDVRLWVRVFWSSEIRDSDRTMRTMTVRVRRDRRDRGTLGKPVVRSASGSGDQHPLQRFELFQALTTTDGNAVQGVPGHDDRHPRLMLQTRFQPVEERSPTGQHDALLHDVRRQFRRRPVQRDLDGVDDGGHRLLDGTPDLLGGDNDRLREPAHEVAATDLRVQLLLQGIGRAERDLDLFRCALSERQAELLLHEGNDRLVELVATDTHRLARHDATKRDDGDLCRAAADVDPHVAGGLVHRKAGTEGGRHSLLNRSEAT